MRTGFRVEFTPDGLGRVIHPADGRTVAVGSLKDGRWRGIEFVYPQDQKCNRTRQAAMRAMQRYGK